MKMLWKKVLCNVLQLNWECNHASKTNSLVPPNHELPTFAHHFAKVVCLTPKLNWIRIQKLREMKNWITFWILSFFASVPHTVLLDYRYMGGLCPILHRYILCLSAPPQLLLPNQSNGISWHPTPACTETECSKIRWKSEHIKMKKKARLQKGFRRIIDTISDSLSLGYLWRNGN